MSILAQLTNHLSPILPVETGVFSNVAPEEYLVITPMADVFEFHADNTPQIEVQEARISLFSKGNYLRRKQQITTALLRAEFSITARRYIGYESDTTYHHYIIDVTKSMNLEE